jgi:hypothetical protein
LSPNPLRHPGNSYFETLSQDASFIGTTNDPAGFTIIDTLGWGALGHAVGFAFLGALSSVSPAHTHRLALTLIAQAGPGGRGGVGAVQQPAQEALLTLAGVRLIFGIYCCDIPVVDAVFVNRKYRP